MGAARRGSTEDFNGGQGLTGRVAWKRLEAVLFFSFWQKNVPCCSFQFDIHYHGQEEEKIATFMEGMGSEIKFWAYWQLSWQWGVKQWPMGHSYIFNGFLK